MEEFQNKRQSQQLMPQQHGHGLFSYIKDWVLKQSNEPIPISTTSQTRNFYIIEKGILETLFPDSFYRNWQVNDVNNDHEFIKQLFERGIVGPYNYVVEESHYVISEDLYNKCQRQFEENQVTRPIHYDNNANNEIIKIGGSEGNYKTLQSHNQVLDKYQPALNGATGLNPENLHHVNNANNEIINHQWIRDLQLHNQKLESENNYLKKEVSINPQKIRELEEKCKTLQLHNQKLESENNYLKKEVSINPQRIRELEEKCKALQLHNQKLESDRQRLIDHNNNLKKEASKYQSALGDATSFHLGNQDSDTTSQLSKDISNLHLNLEKFCGLKKIEINDQKAVEELLKNYECSIKGAIKDNKNLISGALERYIIETIIKKAEEYFDHVENDKVSKEVDEQGDKRQQQNLEAKIVKTTGQLLEMINSFSTIRTGNDKVSKSTPTKLRQQIYGILGNRGFSNTVLDKSDSKMHPFVERLRKEILDSMNRYRKIKDQEKLAEHERIINDIIRQVVNIFFFRLEVQEPIATWKWFPKNSEINALTMDGPWDKDELEYLSVDICAFPLIGFNLDSAGDEKMMFPAQIIANYL